MLHSSTNEQPTRVRGGRAIEGMSLRERNRRIVYAATAGIFQRILQVGSTLILMPILLHVLGPMQFGIWGAASSLAWLTGLVDIGTGAALVTLVARSSVRETANESRRHLAGALAFGSGLAAFMLVAVATALIVGLPKGWSGLYLIVVAGLALNVPLSTANNVWLALQKGYISGLWESIQSLLTLAGLLSAALLTRDLRIYIGVVYAGLVLANLGSLVHLLIIYPNLRPNRAAMSLSAIKEVAGQGMMYFALGIAGGLSFFLDNILALDLLGPEASARMTIAMRICMMAISMLVVLSQPLWPAFAEAAERRDGHWIRRSVLRGTLTLVALTAGSAFVLIAWGEGLLRWWLRTNLGISRGFLVAIAAWIIAQALSRVPNLLLNGLSILRFQILVYSIATAFALGFKFALAPRLGVSGILWSTTITMVAIVIPASVWRIRRWLQETRHVLSGPLREPLIGSTVTVSRSSEENSSTAASTPVQPG